MCYVKRGIKNPVSEEHKCGFDKTYLKVPCGCCPSCRTVKSNDWQVRCYYEFVDNHSQAFFVTLDFDDAHLPSYNGVPCFDSELMKQFFKNLRNRIGKFRYFYASDNAGFLKRPHYHTIILPEDNFSKVDFLKYVEQSWKNGSHEDVELLPSVSNDKLKALKYVSGYVNKDITYNLDKEFQDIPKRYRHRVQASKHFGEKPLHDGRITKDMLLHGVPVTLPIGKNGTLVSLPIPRFYEMKLAYDTTWLKDKYRTEVKKNEFGVQLAKARHNGRYVYLIRLFFASRHNDFSLPDDCAYNLKNWYDAVTRCFDDFDDFKEFVYFRDFLVSNNSSVRYFTPTKGHKSLWPSSWTDIYYDSIRKEYFYRPRWRFYHYVLDELFQSYMDKTARVQCQIEVSRLIERAKARARSELKRNPRKLQYLRRKNFDFSQLY